SQIEGKWTEEWIEQTKGWIKTLERKLKEEEKRRIEKNIVENIERRSLITEPEQVKEETDKFFKKQFRKRQHLFAQLPEDWRSEYAPKEWISEERYEEIMSLILEAEWEENLRIAKKDTAPGMKILEADEPG
ncbi:19862_t:CDS:2, partial [Gigaspora rosea]